MPHWKPSCLRPVDDGGGVCESSFTPSSKTHQDVTVTRRRSPLGKDDVKGCAMIELLRRDDSLLGLTVTGGVDKECRPYLSGLRPGSIAYRSDTLAVGDNIVSVNGIKTASLKHEEIVNLLKNAGERLLLGVEYEMPESPIRSGFSVQCKTLDVLLSRDDGGFGVTVRGGYEEDALKSRPLTITHVRPGSSADREGSVRPGDRIIALNGLDLSKTSYDEFTSVLKQCGDDLVTRVEYDVSIMETVNAAQGPLLVEMSKTPYSKLGLTLNSKIINGKNVIYLDAIRPASVGDRCGALQVGDQLLSINGHGVDHMNLTEATHMLLNGVVQLKLEVMPVRQLPYNPRDVQTGSTGMNAHSTMLNRERGSRSGFNSSARIPTGSRFISGIQRWRMKRRTSSCTSSLSSSSSTGLPFQVCHTDTTKVIIDSRNYSGFGFSLQGGLVPSEALVEPPTISFIEPQGPAERTGILQVGDRVVAINSSSLEEKTMAEVNQLLRESGGRCVLDIEFDVAESIVPNSGTFYIKIPKHGSISLGIQLAYPVKSKAGDYLHITSVVRGSVAHRTGTIQPGDQLLAVDNIRLDNHTIEEAYNLLDAIDGIVKILVKKDEDYSDEPKSNGEISFSVELVRHGQPLGVSLSGGEHPLEPIIISGLTPGGIADRTGAVSVGDRLLSINSDSLRGRTVAEAAAILQSSSDTITLKICKQNSTKKHNELYLSPVSVQADSGYNSVRSELVKTSSTTSSTRTGSWTLSDRPYTNSTPHHINTDTRWPTPSDRLNLSPEVSPPSNDVRGSCDGMYMDNGVHCSQYKLVSDQLLVSSGSELKLVQGTECRGDTDTDTDECRGVSDTDDTQFRGVSDTDDTQFRGESVSVCDTNSCPGDMPTSSPPPDNLLTPTRTKSLDPTSCGDGSPPIQIYRVTLQRDRDVGDFGFSLSDCARERGIYVGCVRPGGPAHHSNIMNSMDRILQINNTRTSSLDCTSVLPLIAATRDKLSLVLMRNSFLPTPNNTTPLSSKPNNNWTQSKNIIYHNNMNFDSDQECQSVNSFTVQSFESANETTL